MPLLPLFWLATFKPRIQRPVKNRSLILPTTRKILESKRWKFQRLCAFSHLVDRGSLELCKAIQAAKVGANPGVGWPAAPVGLPVAAVDLRDCLLTIVANLLLIPRKGVGWVRCSVVAEDLAAAFDRDTSLRWPYGRAVDQCVKLPPRVFVSPELETMALDLCRA